ncbi:MAG: xanthine dehydrogenase family protein molybdopterin-binding subunit, partial [Sphingobacteriales bacterium]
MIRRDFLKNAGFLSIGFSLGGSALYVAAQNPAAKPTHWLAEELPPSLRRHPAIDAWIRITGEGRIQVFTGKMELGQGIRTAIAQVAAEELDMPIEKVDVTLAETGVTPDEGYTAGSGSIDNSAMSVRFAAAAAREKLIAMAALSLNTPASELSLKNGSVIAGKTGKAISFSKLLAGKQITDKVTLPVK